MDNSISKNEIEKVLEYLRIRNSECTWIEVKEEQIDEDKLGETISAIANSCLLEGKEYGYILIGVKDKVWEVVGTSKKLSNFHVKGGQDIELYLKTMLTPEINFYFFDEINIENKKISIVKIESASHTPIAYKKETYVRIGSNNKKLKEFPETTRKLWIKVSGFNYEDTIIKKDNEVEDILKLLDYEEYYRLLKKRIPLEIETIINEFIKEKYIVKKNQKYDITALGGLLLANDLNDFNLTRKGIRVIFYKGVTKTEILEQKWGNKGYANGFTNLMKYIRTKILKEEKINNLGFRETYYQYSNLVIRELIANAIIHQDLSILGNQIKIEFYENRIEISNPGTPIIDVWRFYDTNRTRNLKLASNMNKFEICEELGSGIDKIVEISEIEKRFTPQYIIYDGQYTTVKLFRNREFENMSEDEKLNQVIKKYFSAGGKRVRVLLLLICSKLGDFNNNKKNIIRMASIVEIIHTASLIHDDIIDKAETRRGNITLNKEFGDEFALLVGDYLFSIVLREVSEFENEFIHSYLATTLKELCIGELIQEDGLYNLNTRRLDYLRKIKRKTAILIAFATVSGSIISGAKKEDVDSSYRFGYYLGMSYQIIDDYLDFAGGATSLGKEIGQDLVNGNITLPALIAKEKNENLFLDFNRSINLEKKNVIINYIKNNKDILDETLSISQRYLDKAENSIAEINEEVNKELIFIMNRLARREY